MVVAKKIAKRSVDRNYMRRVLRELFRRKQTQMGPLDLVVRTLKLFNHQDFEKVDQEFTELLLRLGRAIKKDPLSEHNERRHV